MSSSQINYGEALGRIQAILAPSQPSDRDAERKAREVLKALGWREPCPECHGRGYRQVSVSWSGADGMGGGTITQERCEPCFGTGERR